MKPPFVFTQISNRGSSDPIVARTVLQTSALTQGFFLQPEQKEALLGTSFEVQKRLIACQDIADSISKDVTAGKAAIDRGEHRDKDPRVFHLPPVIDLEARSEQFLYQAKLAIRDIAGLFKTFTGNHFDNNFKAFSEWAEKEWGKDDPVVAMLSQDRSWLSRLISFRNAVEHPTHRAGPLQIRSFSVVMDENGAGIREPAWWTGNDAPSAIAPDMDAACHNLLTLYEDLLVHFLRRFSDTRMIDIAEIPEENRREEEPVRFRLVFRPPVAGA